MSEETRQKSLARSAVVKGVGLHTGRKCQTIIHPAEPGEGIRFVRTDLPNRPEMAARVENVVDVVRGTTLGFGDTRIYTIEHLMSALNGLEIDNARIEMDDNEPPVLDGSALGFVEALRSAGIVEQPASKSFFTVREPYEYHSHQTTIRIEPCAELEISCEIEYNHPMITRQAFVYRRSEGYDAIIAPARTFCFDYEIEALKKTGLAKGGSLDNAIVIGPSGIYNPGAALRFNDEFVRHKILDLMGDLMLLGQPIRARVVAKRCGHGHNIKFLRELLESRPAASVAPIA